MQRHDFTADDQGEEQDAHQGTQHQADNDLVEDIAGHGAQGVGHDRQGVAHDRRDDQGQHEGEAQAQARRHGLVAQTRHQHDQAGQTQENQSDRPQLR